MRIVSLDPVREDVPLWFSPETMRWFRSRVSRQGWQAEDGTILFLSSEEKGDARRWTVRGWRGEGAVFNLGDFWAYDSWAAAHRAMLRSIAKMGG